MKTYNRSSNRRRADYSIDFCFCDNSACAHSALENIGRIFTPSQVCLLACECLCALLQAWAINGFTIAFRYSQQARYLAAAQAAADCFLRLLDASAYADSYVPLWDFNATSPEQYARDTSAAAIAADALVELAGFTQDPSLAAVYTAAAKKMLTSLTTAPFTYIGRASESPAFVGNGTVTFPQSGVPLVYGDFYLLSALLKLGGL